MPKASIEDIIEELQRIMVQEENWEALLEAGIEYIIDITIENDIPAFKDKYGNCHIILLSPVPSGK
ncbi:MAG: hypothetical protein QXT31_07475, partial [Candidatus Bathyarchaeia archaeon]